MIGQGGYRRGVSQAVRATLTERVTVRGRRSPLPEPTEADVLLGLVEPWDALSRIELRDERPPDDELTGFQRFLAERYFTQGDGVTCPRCRRVSGTGTRVCPCGAVLP